MTLRLQLILSIIAALVISLIFAGTMAWWNAARSVATEMHAAIDAGTRIVRNTIEQLPATQDDPRYIERLLAVFDGNRHLRAALVDTNNVEHASSLTDSAPSAPLWFENLINVTPETSRIPLPQEAAPYVAIVLATYPRNEIGELWVRTRDDMAILVSFSIAAALMGYWIIGRTLRPLQTLSTGLAVVSGGDYTARVDGGGSPETARLAGAFNHMAEHLGTLEEKNRRLNEQLLSIQEEERADLARDLHDEIGPFLFAVNVDAAAISRLADAADKPEIKEQARAIQEAVSHMQRHVKTILAHLRSPGLLDIGLEQAVVNLATFWQRRHGEISIRVEIAAESFGESRDSAIYRLIQEGLSNAVRHAQARVINIAVRTHDDIIVEIADDGIGFTPPPNDSSGFGLVGMRERVNAMGGTLVMTTRPDKRGTVVTVRLPLGT